MAVTAFSSLRTKIRRQLQDSDGTYWTDDELDAYINEGQEEYVRETKCLVTNANAVVGGTVALMTFPTDFLDFVRMVNSDGDEISKAHWDELRETYGDDFMDDAGAPLYVYSDLGSENTFRLYPAPGNTSGYTELGAIVYWEPGSFDTDYGAVVDIDVDDDTVTFETEEGAVTTIYADTVTLYYVRKPTDDTLEIDDTLALEYYALNRAYMKDEDTQNFQKAQAYRAAFEERITMGKMRKHRTYVGKPYRGRLQTY